MGDNVVSAAKWATKPLNPKLSSPQPRPRTLDANPFNPLPPNRPPRFKGGGANFTAHECVATCELANPLNRPTP